MLFSKKIVTAYLLFWLAGFEAITVFIKRHYYETRRYDHNLRTLLRRVSYRFPRCYIWICFSIHHKIFSLITIIHVILQCTTHENILCYRELHSRQRHHEIRTKFFFGMFSLIKPFWCLKMPHENLKALVSWHASCKNNQSNARLDETPIVVDSLVLKALLFFN